MRLKLNVVETYRVDTLEEVEDLHEEMKTGAIDYELKGFDWKKKEKKAKGAIVDEGYEVKVTKHHCDFFMNGLEG